MFDYDAELRLYHRRLCAAMEVGPGDSILDIGCGTGLTTREAARRAVEGNALGVDVSAPMLARARELGAAEELHNVRFEQADAQIHPFPPEHFSLAISRFGTMFFADPVEAFSNIRRALRPGARFVQLVWQDGGRQEWVAAIRQALVGGGPQPDGDAFSLADPAVVDGVLTAAGFTDVRITDVREPVFYGADPDAAVDAVLALRMPSDQLVRMEAESALERLRTIMAAHSSTGGVWFDSRAWLITARR